MNEHDDLIPTRRSLVGRLKDWNDQESWRAFFDTYWRLIYGVAVKAGLSDAEAQDVVQETVISVLKSMPTFDYEQKRGSFKGWLYQLTYWRIADHKRRRDLAPDYPNERDPKTSTRTGTLAQMPDPGGPSVQALWDQEWESNLMEAALERVKRRVDPAQYQVFDLHVMKGWPVSKVAAFLHVNPARVYVTKHRIGGAVKKELARLRAKPI